MRIHWPPPNRSFGFVDALGIVGAVGLLVARFVPVAKLPFWGCVLRKYTGWPCPGCGLTRAADRFSHGNILGALEANPLGTLAAAGFFVCAVWMVLHLGFKVPVPEVVLDRRESTRLRWGLLVALLLNYGFVVVKTRFPELL